MEVNQVQEFLKQLNGIWLGLDSPSSPSSVLGYLYCLGWKALQFLSWNLDWRTCLLLVPSNGAFSLASFWSMTYISFWRLQHRRSLQKVPMVEERLETLASVMMLRVFSSLGFTACFCPSWRDLCHIQNRDRVHWCMFWWLALHIQSSLRRP